MTLSKCHHVQETVRERKRKFLQNSMFVAPQRQTSDHRTVCVALSTDHRHYYNLILSAHLVPRHLITEVTWSYQAVPDHGASSARQSTLGGRQVLARRRAVILAQNTCSAFVKGVRRSGGVVIHRCVVADRR